MATDPRNHVLVILFDVFVLLGCCLLLSAILPAVLSKAVQRSIAWHSLMMAWLVYAFGYGLLVGRQEGPDPPLGICLGQTVLIYATPPLVSTATTCYYIEFFLIVYSIRSSTTRHPNSGRGIRAWLVITPWAVFLTIIIVNLLFIFLGHRLSQVERKPIGFYCHLSDGTPNIITASVVVTGMALLLSLEGYTGYLMFKNWNIFKMMSTNDRQIFLILYVRLILCTLAAILAFVLSTLALVPKAGPDLPTFVYPILSIFVAFAFGTQKDAESVVLAANPLPKGYSSKLAILAITQPYGSIIFNNGTRNDTFLASTTIIQTTSGDVLTTCRDGSQGISGQNQSEGC